MNKRPLLQAQSVSKTFRKNKNNIEVLKRVDVTLYEKEMVAIIGSSGAGKSTLLHVLGTLERPTSGEIFFHDDGNQVQVSKLGDEALSSFRNKSLGFIFQFHYLLPEFSALENVMMPALIAGHSWRPAADQARSLLKYVGLENRLEHRPSELSGGEQQRVAIARSIILRPKIILADELTGNLDSKNKDMVLDLLIRLHEETGVSILLVTHDMSLTKKMHRVLEMQDGSIH